MVSQEDVNSEPLTAREWARMVSRPDVYGLEALSARFIRHRDPRHVHEFYVFGMIAAGQQTFSTRRARHATATGGLIILNPDEPHTGEPATETGFTYKAIYPSAELMGQVASQAGVRGGLPFFSGPITYDGALTRRFLSLHRALVSPETRLAGETLLVGFLAAVIRRCADARPAALDLPGASPAILTTRDYLEAHYGEPVSLDELARLVSISPYHLARLFTAQMGIPPHAYLESVRIRQARRLLTLGRPILEVALSTGFADQSHFTRRFKRTVGVPPGDFVKHRKIVQDPPR